MSSLLAKSPRGTRSLSLHQHLLDTEQAAGVLFREGTRWASSYLRFFRLTPDEHPRFLLNLRVAALAHDLGKANEAFQRAVSTKTPVPQSLRHEHLSALLLAHPDVRSWLSASRDLDIDIVLAAVLSHHLKASANGEWKFLQLKGGRVALHFDDPQVRATLDRISEVAGVAHLRVQLPDRYDHPGWEAAWQWFWSRVPKFARELRDAATGRRRSLLLAMKAGVIAADSVASAMVREGLSIESWIEAVAHREALAPGQVEADILRPRIDEISRVRSFRPHRFQEGAANVGRRGLLLAGCGAGKTLAAWRWADAVSRQEPIGRVIFLYPTRGTATEGFRDYVAHAPEGRPALVHGTAPYELEGMQTNPPPSLAGKSFVPDEGEARLFALGLWSKTYFSATVDQFLSFIEHGYGGLCLLPALADAAVVFDEVHSYDQNMWNALVAFLQNFDVPVLCMTATLPAVRRRTLAKHLRVYPSPEDRADLQDLEAAEGHLRYRLDSLSGEEEAYGRALASVRAGKRVLWVVNTVRRCQNLARRLRDGAVPVLVYHSRFRLCDRQDRHRETIDAFRAGRESSGAPPIAVTTQVCEMSLDLDADVLVTEHAPISSLVQRFGRANRHHERRAPEFRADIWTYPPESRLPYEAEELEPAARFLAAFAGQEASQRDLALALETYSPKGRDPSGSTRFVDGGYFATPGPLREEDSSGALAILDCDIEDFRALLRARKPTDGLRLNVPKKFARPAGDPGLPSWLMLAEGTRYDRSLGFLVDE